LPVLRGRRSGRLFPGQAWLVLLNAGLFLLALDQMLWPDYRGLLALTMVVLAALHFGVALALPHRPEPSVAHLLYGRLALTFASLVFPIILEGKWITIAWAIEGAVLTWSGFTSRRVWLRTAGLVLFAAITARLLLFPIPARTFLWNARFAT